MNWTLQPWGLMRMTQKLDDIVPRLRQALTRPGRSSSDFDLNPDTVVPAGRKLRAAGVLVPISIVRDVPQVILTKRSSSLQHHPGQIAFPGGKQDESDLDVTATALREAKEEIGLPSHMAEVLGLMPEHETVTSFKVTPVVAILREEFSVLPEPGEVEEVFSVPLSHVLEPENYLVESRRWRGQRRYYFSVPYGPYYIWGATARMLRALADRMQE